MQKLNTTEIANVDISKVGGDRVFNSYETVVGFFEQNSKEQLLNFFAQPSVNTNSGIITWYTKAVGQARPFSELNDSERASLVTKIKSNCQEIRELSNAVEKASGTDVKLARTLRAMLISPEIKDSIFDVDGTPVMTQWGCSPFKGSTRNSDLIAIDDRLKSLTTTSVIDTPQSPEEQGNKPLSASSIKAEEVTARPSEPLAQPVEPLVTATKPTDLPPDNPPITAGTDIATPSSAHPVRWRWLIILLLTLLLIAGLLLKKWFYPPQYDYEAENKLRENISELWIEVDNKNRVCRPPVSATPPPTAQDPAASAPPVLSTDEVSRRLENESVSELGAVNVSLAWSGPYDLDLIVIDPTGWQLGPYVSSTEKRTGASSPSGGKLDIDANRCVQMSGCAYRNDPVENISWKESPPKGRYRVLVGVFSINSKPNALASIPFTVVVTVNQKKNTFNGIIEPKDVQCTEQRCSTPALMPITSFSIE